MLLKLKISRTGTEKHRIEAEYMLTWTHVHYQDGRKYYHILPSPVADTLLKEGTYARQAYDLFIDDSHMIMGTEIPEMVPLTAEKAGGGPDAANRAVNNTRE